MSQSISIKDTKKIRQSNFELLRIFAMFLIIAHHLASYSGFQFSIESITIPRLWIQFIKMGGKIGVSIFVLISGYFLINTKSIKISKVLKLLLHMFFYSFIMYLLVVAFGVEKFRIINLITSMFPTIYSIWWFASAYLVLYILTPFINRFLCNLDKKSYQSLLLLFLVIWCIIPTVTTSLLQSNNLIWVICLYSIGGYIRLWSSSSNKKCSFYFIIAIILTLLNFSAVIILDLIGKNVSLIAKHTTYFYGFQTIPTLMISLFIFLGFKNLKIKYHKFINLVSLLTFGIYLIHDNKWLRKVIWVKLFKTASYSNTMLIIPYSIVAVLIVFIVCGLIEFIRIHVLEDNYMKVIEKLNPYWNKAMNKINSNNSKLFELLEKKE